MPSLPAKLADLAEQIYAHPATVTDVRPLSRGLRIVTFAGPALVGHAWEPGQEIEVRVTPTALRHYTPMTFDPAAGCCRVLFHLAVPGPGTSWARRLAPGDVVRFRGPGGGLRPLAGSHYLFLGDSTAIGAFHALLFPPGGPPPGREVRGAVEVAPHDADAVRPLLPGIDVLGHHDAPGAALARWLEHTLAADVGRLPDACRLIGHANSLRVLRTRLQRAGVPRRQIQLTPYWATGRTGL